MSRDLDRRSFLSGWLATSAAALSGCAAHPSGDNVAPSLSYTQAVSLARSVIERDRTDPTLLESALPRLYVHDARAAHAVILFHGFTNSPQQFDELARGFFALGCNVFVPRIPHHGLKNRLTLDLANLTLDELRQSALQAFAIARGLGETSNAVGLSLGGTMVLWLTQTQPLDLALPVAPFLMPMNVPQLVGPASAALLDRLPDMYWFWDSKLKERSLPVYAYPGYPSRSMARVLALAGEILDASKRQPPRARQCVLILNEHENAISNDVALGLLAAWNSHGVNYRNVMLANLGEPRHDIIDPTTYPRARSLVYPLLERLVTGRPAAASR